MSTKIKTKSALNQKSTSEKVVFTVAFIILLIYALSFMFPLVWLLFNSLKSQLNYLDDFTKAIALPKWGKWQFENYLEAVQGLSHNRTNFIGMFFNSIWTSVVSLALNMFLSCCTGYVLAKYRFKGRDFIYGVAIVCMTLPIFGTGGATYTFYHQTQMYNTPFYVVFSSLGAFGTRFLMLYGFFKSVSWDYAEAVFIDGGNDYTVFFRIMLPLAFPMIATLCITGFIGQWNAYESYLIYLPSFPTIAVGIYEVRAKYTNDQPVYFSAMIISMIPVIVLFCCFADTIMKNFSIGGLKG